MKFNLLKSDAKNLSPIIYALLLYTSLIQDTKSQNLTKLIAKYLPFYLPCYPKNHNPHNRSQHKFFNRHTKFTDDNRLTSANMKATLILTQLLP